MIREIKISGRDQLGNSIEEILHLSKTMFPKKIQIVDSLTVLNDKLQILYSIYELDQPVTQEFIQMLSKAEEAECK